MNASGRFDGAATVFLRIALAGGFLSAVADRFGLWGPSGTPNVSWGDFANFTAYVAKLNGFAPQGLVPDLAWTATAAEVVLAVALLLGLFTRTSAALSGLMLLTFGAAMTLSLGIKAPLDYSVFAAAGAAFLLALAPRYALSLDAVLQRRKAVTARPAGRTAHA